ncbi:glycosyltransferase family 87 protein [Nocardioides sp.]|uniref:glycosyltransferase family 87 protein n=1 Tax=Nocardioides sp. TaxID=35761 RepID=UPI002C65B070|nr:glycosyltransferase 87 family protein [Nocardioides sp.]HSX67355.1 glycosyltransferase 87 family protein [Nocardioides sp.]
MTERVQPSLDDPVLTALSEGIGGPVGGHARPARWWTPVRVVLALAALAFALGMLQKQPCWADDWTDGHERYVAMCYSDVPYLYTGRGFAELLWPYDDDAEVRAKYEVMEYPVGIAYAAWAAAHVSHWLLGDGSVEPRAEVGADQVLQQPGVLREQRGFVVATTLSLAVATLAAAWALARVHRRRPYDAALFAASPVLVVNALVNWDLLAVALVAGALLAWSRQRPVLTGVLIGLGVATKLYPLFLLGGIVVICLRSRAWRTMLTVAAATALAWLLANLPAMATGWDEWMHFWRFNDERGADLGSLWLVLAQAGVPVSTALVNNVSLVGFGLWCLVVLVIGLRAPETPRLAQLGFLVVAGFLVFNKVYSPQYVLWLLPLAVMARPRWRDQLAWQAGELLYFASVWWYLDNQLASGGGTQPVFYWLAIIVRVACELWLVAVVVRDIRRPAYDVVRRTDPSADEGPVEGRRREVYA